MREDENPAVRLSLKQLLDQVSEDHGLATACREDDQWVRVLGFKPVQRSINCFFLIVS